MAVQKRLQKSAHRAQKNLRQMRRATQKRVASGWSATQDRLEEGSKQVRKSLEQVATTAKGANKALRKRSESMRRKRRWSRRLFRWGLVSGFLVALLFAPISGAETRKRLALLWNQYKQYLIPGTKE